MAAKTFSTYLSELSEVTSLGAGDRIPVLESSATKYVDGGDVVASYLKYVALLTQSGTNAPVATVLENTLGGTVVWSYNSAGDYTGTLSGAFTENKTWFATPGFDWSGSLKYANIGRTDANTVQLFTSTEDGTTTADNWSALPIEIRVYP